MITTKNITLGLGALVKKDDVVEVEGTGVTDFLPFKKKFTVHRLHAQTLINAGKAKLV